MGKPHQSHPKLALRMGGGQHARGLRHSLAPHTRGVQTRSRKRILLLPKPGMEGGGAAEQGAASTPKVPLTQSKRPPVEKESPELGLEMSSPGPGEVGVAGKMGTGAQRCKPTGGRAGGRNTSARGCPCPSGKQGWGEPSWGIPRSGRGPAMPRRKIGPLAEGLRTLAHPLCSPDSPRRSAGKGIHGAPVSRQLS